MKLIPSLLAILYLVALGSAMSFYPQNLLQFYHKIQPWDKRPEDRLIRDAKFGGWLLLFAACFLMVALILTRVFLDVGY